MKLVCISASQYSCFVKDQNTHTHSHCWDYGDRHLPKVPIVIAELGISHVTRKEQQLHIYML